LLARGARRPPTPAVGSAGASTREIQSPTTVERTTAVLPFTYWVRLGPCCRARWEGGCPGDWRAVGRHRDVRGAVSAREVSTLAAALLVPYLAWTSFATFVNVRIYQLNRGGSHVACQRRR